MSVHLRHPGCVPALFSREAEPRPPRRGLAAVWHGLLARSRPARSGGLSTQGPLLGGFAPSLVLLAAETPLIKAAESLLSVVLPR